MAATALSRVHSSASGYGAVDTPPTSPLLPSSSVLHRDSCEHLFKFLVLTQVFMYLEAGAVPSLLQQFTLTFRLSPQEQGLLGAIVYISISLASPWCSTLFRRFDPRQLLGVSLVVNNLAVLGLACTPTSTWYSKSLLISLRGFVGLTQAFSCVYSPLWVHDYAPKAKRGTWMSYLQGAVPVGITLGYFAGSVTIWLASQGPEEAATAVQSVVSALSKAALGINANADIVDGIDDASMRLCHGIYCWRWPFLTQFALILPLSILIFFVPREHIRLRSTRRRSIVIVDADEDVDTGEENASRWSNLWLLLQHRVYVFIVMGLSGLFFVVAGVQFWTTLYLETNTTGSTYEIHLSYLLVSGTGPIMGVFFGGWLIDQFGGYSGPYHQMQALRVCMVLGGAGCLAALPVSYVHNTFSIAVFLWLMLFCGGSILPACSGIVISAAPPRLRPLASSVAYASYNLFGYAASNYIPGFIMNFIIDPSADADADPSDLGNVGSCNAACTYRIGFRIVLFWSVWAFFCLTCGAIESGRNYAATVAAHSNGHCNGNGKQHTTATTSHQPVSKSAV
ncbi:Major Facilitator Superfamily (MFS) [Phytophthora infestans T30-4]|uniref:Major Facilitator Superfamily (MFS) n=1 Tax=Phytophthora infestans (strain T30-4) TaxID=403677 RepID=D0NJ87_PHYIT|nr:Major Facilitator Superfamily (MFS) [Phytophthora infestans T30-4]EEY59605.1 Major Facilitator Superfamily (MFS) [Phytophthora infestans T30-4]|eukprot:XP_002900798.1 Major Facilitator Superfamily (MFS) [Phytophthora infestans T30-4]